jgi:hypothetical protein
MLELANPGSEVPNEESNGTIRNLLHILYGRDIRVLTIDEMENLLNVADKYDILRVTEYIALKCHTLLQNNFGGESSAAFKILCLAARLDDEALAKAAVPHLTSPSPLTWNLRDVTRLGLRYYLGVIHAWHAICLIQPPGSQISLDWARAAYHFKTKD